MINFDELMRLNHPDGKVEMIEYVSRSKPMRFKCLLCGEEGACSRGQSFWARKYACQKCQDGNKQKTDRQKRIEEIYNSPSSTMKLISYHGHNPCKIKCLRCGRTINRYAANILKNPSFCSYCDTPKQHIPFTKEQAQRRLNELSKTEDFELLEFTNTTNKSLMRHKPCGFIFLRRIENFPQCPKCQRKKSILEKTVEEYLIENGFAFSVQKRFVNCNNNKSSFDFCLYHKNGTDIVLIEVQGQQHFKEVDYFSDGSLEDNQRRDKLKRDYCLANNILLIEIPYWDIDKISQYLPLKKFNDYRTSNGQVE